MPQEYGGLEKLYYLALYALLHDIGKPIQRMAMRHVEGVEDASGLSEEVKHLFGMDLDTLSRTKHDVISEKIVNILTGVAPGRREKEVILRVLRIADPFAAAERGVGDETLRCLPTARELGTELGIKYDYYLTPLLSPLWMLVLTGYRDSVGPVAYATKRVGEWTAEEAMRRLGKALKPLVESISRCSRDATKIEAEFLRKLIDLRLWIPAKPADESTLEELKAFRYHDALSGSSYVEVVKTFIDLINRLLILYEPPRRTGVSKGFVDTLLSVLKATGMFVPAAVSKAVVPDTSLYSHSKLVAAYATALEVSRSRRMRLLAIDANGIQRFVSAPIKAAAASRMMRGRSLLVELSIDALTSYALELFGGLPEANVVISEGGTLDMVVPDLDDLDLRLEELRRAADELSRNELGYSLGFTVAISTPFGEESPASLRDFVEGGGLSRALTDLMRELALEKAVRGARMATAIPPSMIEDYDTLTGEPVLKGRPYNLRVTQGNLDYASSLAGPDKLGVGDVISEASHLSLAAGNASRNLVGVVAVYAYKKVQDVARPYPEFIHGLVKKVSERVCRGSGRLLCSPVWERVRMDIALIPLASAGALYIVVGLHEAEPYVPGNESMLRDAWMAVSHVLNELAAALRTAEWCEDCVVRVRVRMVNTVRGFLPSEQIAGDLAYRNVTGFLREASRLGVDVGFGYIFANSYHPTYIERREGESRLMLVDLDMYGLIALGKLDVDSLGEVRSLLSHFPSRLVTLSDLLNSVLAGKVYLKFVGKAYRLVRERKRLLDAIPLYAGGDDVTIYGRWSHVIYAMWVVHREVEEALYPLTASSAIAIDRDRAPIYDLYSRAVEELEGRAKVVKASTALGAPGVREVSIDDAAVTLEVMPPLPREPWPGNDPATCWSLEALGKLFEKVIDGDDVLSKLEVYKRELHILSRLGYMVQVTKERGAGKPLSAVDVRDRLGVVIAYAYAWARRGEELRKAVDELLRATELSRCGTAIYSYPDDVQRRGASGAVEALRLLLAAKPVLDYVLLAIRRRDYSTPTAFEQVKQ